MGLGFGCFGANCDCITGTSACSACQNLTTPNSFIIRYGGFIDGWCTQCSTWNSVDIEVPFLNTCNWQLILTDMGNMPCTSTPGGGPLNNYIRQIDISMGFDGTNYLIAVSLLQGPGGQAGTTFNGVIGTTKPNCLTDLTSVSLTLTGSMNEFFNSCGTTAATCQIVGVT